ncbi:hypothetical protein SCHRY_v1c04480 [Spiroplasma chrysopicola DF-1]|uniref:Uncharacterized protein n=1 Tax=Spiroplasma chrysopicola DF-1 TaxID=1276227 RepID=R4UAU5_9MOLU|nr:hypothetical protein [Spiroplasma chrysopicola]AGM25029.1 hypothetical protein SCHRY_v1c04480 [Spiroplasma chrysopicola DF-1]
MSGKTTVQKYAIIGPEYQNKYPCFLDIVDNNQAVEFWTTIHSDYQIKTPNGKDIIIYSFGLRSLLNDKDNPKDNPQFLTVSVNTLVTSTILIGNETLSVCNSATYNSETSYDLSAIQFKNYQYNFSKFNAEQLRNWIYQDVKDYMTIYKYNDIDLNEDYGISANKIPNENPETYANIKLFRQIHQILQFQMLLMLILALNIYYDYYQ